MCRLRAAALALACASCGVLGRGGGGATDLPVSAAGPYRRLLPDERTPIDEPVVAEQRRASLDDPFALVDGEAIALWVTWRETEGAPRVSDLRHADFVRLEDGPGPFAISLAATQPWEGGWVAEPCVVAPRPPQQKWLLFYAAAGGIGWATSEDGHQWTKGPGPLLSPRGDERFVRSPAALRLGGDRLRLLYLAADGVRAADGGLRELVTLAPPALLRRGGAPLVQPGAAPWLGEIGRLTAQTIETAGRTRYDLFLGGRVALGERAIGLAASFDGLGFAVAPQPFVDGRPPEEWAPIALPYRAGSLLLFAQTRGIHSAIVAATSP